MPNKAFPFCTNHLRNVDILTEIFLKNPDDIALFKKAKIGKNEGKERENTKKIFSRSFGYKSSAS